MAHESNFSSLHDSLQSSLTSAAAEVNSAPDGQSAYEYFKERMDALRNMLNEGLDDIERQAKSRSDDEEFMAEVIRAEEEFAEKSQSLMSQITSFLSALWDGISEGLSWVKETVQDFVFSMAAVVASLCGF